MLHKYIGTSLYAFLWSKQREGPLINRFGSSNKHQHLSFQLPCTDDKNYIPGSYPDTYLRNNSVPVYVCMFLCFCRFLMMIPFFMLFVTSHSMSNVVLILNKGVYTLHFGAKNSLLQPKLTTDKGMRLLHWRCFISLGNCLQNR